MEEIQTTLNDSKIDARLFEFARKNGKELKFILQELEEYRKLKRAENDKK